MLINREQGNDPLWKTVKEIIQMKRFFGLPERNTSGQDGNV